MDRNTGANRTPEGLFRDGDPVSNTPATALTALWANGITEELRNVILAAGLDPDANDWTQLRQALGILGPVGSQIGYAATTSTDSDYTELLIPWDDTPPQASEGKEFTSLRTSYTPRFASSLLEVEAKFSFVIGRPAEVIMALFRDDGASAIAATIGGSASVIGPALRAIVPASSATETIFKVRFGARGNVFEPSAVIGYYGTDGAAPLLGSARIHTLTVREIRQ